jgi:ABC-type multidrug transport system fused ATPase/permease subunit
MFGVGGYLILERAEITAGQLFTFMGLLAAIYNPLRILSKTYTRLQESLVGAERVYEVLDTPPTITDREGAQILDFTQPLTVRFERVHFDYGKGEVLSGVDLDVPPGTFIGIAGRTGAGKSTFVDLITRFYDVTGGRVTINGTDVRDFTRDSLYGAVSFVPQDPFLFNTTVRENLIAARPTATEDEMFAAARAANIHDRIMALPQRYDTVVGERGVLLSGGEKQRVTIARALLKDSPILLLDEAMSALDTETEHKVQEAIAGFWPGGQRRTVISIAHRLSTITGADRILYMQDGKIAESGTHAELMATGGAYAALWSAQQSGHV